MQTVYPVFVLHVFPGYNADIMSNLGLAHIEFSHAAVLDKPVHGLRVRVPWKHEDTLSNGVYAWMKPVLVDAPVLVFDQDRHELCVCV